MKTIRVKTDKADKRGERIPPGRSLALRSPFGTLFSQVSDAPPSAGSFSSPAREHDPATPRSHKTPIPLRGPLFSGLRPKKREGRPHPQPLSFREGSLLSNIRLIDKEESIAFVSDSNFSSPLSEGEGSGVRLSHLSTSELSPLPTHNIAPQWGRADRRGGWGHIFLGGSKGWLTPSSSVLFFCLPDFFFSLVKQSKKYNP